MASPTVLDRYRIEDSPVGQGGMGIVYKAFDNLTKRYVALKTLKGEVDPACIEMFQKEWMQLAQLSHPNIVDVLDIGDFVQGGRHKPYFVMPLLQGSTLDELIQTAGSRLTPERTIEILCQTCRGLQAAHDRGLVHRDLKPSNVFVMNDDTVKIIDFGIVHLVDTQSRTGMKGTLQYMAPEQLEMKPASSRSDIFSLGVVCYEALTGRKPFQRASEEETFNAIRSHMPTPVSELNHAVNDQISRAVQKAMAKQPYHRFATAREFSEILQRSLRNEHIELFDRSRIQPRVNRIKKALADGDFQLATDMLDEVEAEGNIDPELPALRLKTEQAGRSRVIYQLIESARTRMEEEEYPLALQNVQRVLDLDPTNIDALAMKGQIERQRSVTQVGKWLQIAQQHFDNRLFEKARQAIEEVRKLDPSNQSARELLLAVTQGEQETTKVRHEKQQLYDSALQGYRNGELSSALTKLQKVIELGKRTPGHPHTDAQYMALYEQIRSEHDELHNSYAEGKKNLQAGNFDKALDICKDVLSRRPGEPLFHALKIEIEDLRRQESSADFAHIHSQIEAEADLERKLSIVAQAVRQFPDEKLFAQSLQLVKERRDLVNTIVSRARQYESQRLYTEASNQWDIIRNIYPQFPGLDYELQRLTRKQQEHGKEEAKAVWMDRIDRALFIRDYRRAEDFLQSALLENPGDSELLQLRERIGTAAETSKRAHSLLESGETLSSAGNKTEAIEKLRAARELDDSDPSIRAVLKSTLIEHSRALVEQDWRSALPFIEEALEIDPADPGAANVARTVEDMRQREQIAGYLAAARDLRASRMLTDALAKVEEGLRDYPNEIRLTQLRNTLQAAVRQEASAAEPPAGGQASGFEATKFFSPELEVQEKSQLEQPAAAVQASTSRLEDGPAGGLQFKTKLFAAIAALIVVGALVVFRLSGSHTAKTPAPSDVQSQAAVQPPGTHPLATPKLPETAQRTLAANQKQAVDSSKQQAVAPVTSGPDFTSFKLVSDPAGASVTVDGDAQLTCTTPCDFPLLKGPHKLVFSKPGYEPARSSVRVPEDFSRTELLAPALQKVRIISDPPGAKLTVDGEPRGVTPKSLPLTTGTHKVVIASGEDTAEEDIEVNSESLVFTIQLNGEPTAH